MLLCRLSVALVALTALPALAQTITVDYIEDVVDFPSPQQVPQLPGPDGLISFREALNAANNTPGPQTIKFAIPKDQWWLLDTQAFLVQDFDLFALTDDATTIDFLSQKDFTGDTNPNGNEVGIYGVHPNAMGVASMWIFADNCVIKGLGDVHQRGYAVEIKGNNNRVIGCHTDGGLYAAVYITGGFGGPSPHGNIVGGTEPGEGNFLTSGNTGVRIDGPANDNIVIGNTLTGVFHGVEVRGATDFDMFAVNNRIGGPTPAERNIISGAGKFGEEGFPTGTQVSIEDADGTIIEGNYIGTNAEGTGRPAVQRGPGGVEVRSSRDTIIRGNLISGLRVAGVNHAEGQVFGVAINVEGNADNTIIQDNLIGTDFTGTQPIPTYSGIATSWFPGEGSPTATFVGGDGPGQANLIAFTDTIGVIAGFQTAGTTISGNSIHDNGALGIDLIAAAGPGVTPNDHLDPDTGGNNLQNFPVLDTAVVDGGATAITGKLDSAASRQFTIEFFSSPACDPSGFGEGEMFLGSTVVTTNGNGHAEFAAHVDPVQPGSAITATATDQTTGDTSEFSACIDAQGGDACYPDFTGDGALDLFDFLEYANAFNAGDEAADCTNDNTLDLFDFLCFVNAFDAGC
jgi:hypothetical protein